MNVDLLTRTGDFVAEVLVPIMNPPAEVLLWGSRFFIRSTDDGKYREGIVWTVLDECVVR